MAVLPAGPTLMSPAATATFEAPAGWRAIDFISDLHLSAATPRGFDAWADHLLHTSADAVFILGDLFEVWLGDDLAERGFEARCVEVLSRAARRVSIAFMPGNRDFLVGDSMLGASGVQRLLDPTVIVSFGQRVVVSHGDLLCVDDISYQRYRRVVHLQWLQRFFGALPLATRRAIGGAIQRRSGRREPRPEGGYVDVDRDEALAWLRRADAPTLVHGHTHAPASHELAPGRVRHVLSDWELDGSSVPRAEVLRWTTAGFARIAPQTGPAPASASSS